MSCPCKDCWRATLTPHWGGFNMACIGCCARLVLSCSPDKQQAEAMLGAITMRPGRPTRKEVLAAVRERKASPPAPATAQETLL